jgi:hypothetical protein
VDRKILSSSSALSYTTLSNSGGDEEGGNDVEGVALCWSMIPVATRLPPRTTTAASMAKGDVMTLAAVDAAAMVDVVAEAAELVAVDAGADPDPLPMDRYRKDVLAFSFFMDRITTPQKCLF